ncbi:signal peptidase II [bacterium]|nr:signal peptidase II [bacterium]
MLVFILFFCSLAADQITKYAVRETMVLGQSIPVLGDFFRLTYVENPGIAFGIQIGNGAVFTVLSLLASIGIIVYLATHWHESNGMKNGLALILGGAFGNLIDRILHGRVVDFLEVGIRQYRWPVFNVADSAVVIGMIVLFITVFKAEKEAKEREGEHLSETE